MEKSQKQTRAELLPVNGCWFRSGMDWFRLMHRTHGMHLPAVIHMIPGLLQTVLLSHARSNVMHVRACEEKALL